MTPAGAPSDAAAAISVIIPFRNSDQTIRRTLDSLLSQRTARPVEIILVDDHSTDATLDIIRNHPVHVRWPVRVIPNERGGLARAYNLGWKAATGAIVVLMHSDCYVTDDGALERMAEPFSDPGVVAVESWTTVPENDWDSMSFWDKVANARYAGREGLGMGGKFDALRRSTLEQIGGYDEERFFSAGEDVDMGPRLKAVGRIASTEVRVVHGHLYPARARLQGLFTKQFQLGMGFGAVVRKYGRYPGSAQTLYSHILKAGLFLALLIPPLCAPALGGLLVMGALYSLRAFSVRDSRIVLIPFVNVGLFATFLAGALAGWLSGRQSYYYK